jgi:hypothetical protein
MWLAPCKSCILTLQSPDQNRYTIRAECVFNDVRGHVQPARFRDHLLEVARSLAVGRLL